MVGLANLAPNVECLSAVLGLWVAETVSGSEHPWPQVMMMFLMRLPVQTRYTILSEGCSCPTMPNDDENVFFLIHLGSYGQLYH